jgi:hypothetical protein
MKVLPVIFFLTALAMLPTDLLGSPSEARVKRSIENLLRNPMSSSAMDAGAEIIEYAGKTPNYNIELKVGYMPWVKERSLPKGSQVLLAAFVAGNLREQMLKNSARPEPYAGVVAALGVYEKMKRSDVTFRIATAEKFLAMERRGTLRSHIASVR